jgi:hypothetical protein
MRAKELKRIEREAIRAELAREIGEEIGRKVLRIGVGIVRWVIRLVVIAHLGSIIWTKLDEAKEEKRKRIELFDEMVRRKEEESI